MADQAKNILSFLRICGKLKHLLRTGWVNNHVQHPETVASHMHRMSIIAMLVPDAKINKERAIKMCLVHDLAEALVGDITPHDNVSDEDKHTLEKNAFEKMCTIVKNSKQVDADIVQTMDLIYELWNEYETQTSIESQLVKDIDKFDMILQADEYEQDQQKNLESFFESTVSKIQHPFMKDLTKELTEQRSERFAKKQ